jgi:fructose transport system permease protein
MVCPAFWHCSSVIAAGVLAGAINGTLVTRLKLPPFIVTLGTLSIFTSIALLYSGGQQVGRRQLPPILNWAGTPIIIGPFRLTTGVIIVAILAVIMAFILGQTSWGRHGHAVGDDQEAPGWSAFRVDQVLLSVYTVAGLIYGITAWVQIGRDLAPRVRTR